MSWINDLKEVFSRTELEKKVAEAQLQAEASVKITEKLIDFQKAYTTVSNNKETKDICDKLLKKIEILQQQKEVEIPLFFFNISVFQYCDVGRYLDTHENASNKLIVTQIAKESVDTLGMCQNANMSVFKRILYT